MRRVVAIPSGKVSPPVMHKVGNFPPADCPGEQFLSHALCPHKLSPLPYVYNLFTSPCTVTARPFLKPDLSTRFFVFSSKSSRTLEKCSLLETEFVEFEDVDSNRHDFDSFSK